MHFLGGIAFLIYLGLFITVFHRSYAYISKESVGDCIKSIVSGNNPIYVVISLFLAFPVVFYFNFFNGAFDNYRYILSTISQSQAAILGIIVSITFVIIQIATERFSIFTFKIFLDNKFWMLFSVFSASIVFSIIMQDF